MQKNPVAEPRGNTHYHDEVHAQRYTMSLFVLPGHLGLRYEGGRGQARGNVTNQVGESRGHGECLKILFIRW